jgi:hypothetical protein
VSEYEEIQSGYGQTHKGLYGVNNTNAAHQKTIHTGSCRNITMDARGGFGANEEVDIKEY